MEYDVEYFALRILSAVKVDRAVMRGCRPEPGIILIIIPR